MTHSLMLGELVLTGDASFPDPTHGFWFEVSAEGTEFGSPEAVTRIVTSLLADGAVVSYDSDGNREVPVRVRVHGPTLAAVSQGEAALRRASKRRNELTWQPPDTFAPASVYETYPSPMRSVQDSGWDLDELVRRVRTVSLILTCAPHARSLEATTVAALVPGSTTVTVDTCDSATGWDGTRNGFPYAASAAWEAGAVAVAELEDAFTSPETWTLTRTGSIDMTATGFLVAQIRTISSDVGDPMNVTAYAGGSTSSPELPVLSSRLIPGSVYFEVVYDASGLVLPAVTFRHVSTPGQIWQGLFVRSLARTDVAPNITARQQSRIIEVGGTERTPASIHVQTPDGEGALLQAIVHTCPEDGSGYSPPLRRWRVSTGTVAADVTAYSGESESIAMPAGFGAEVPTSALPEGGYVLMARIRLVVSPPADVTVFWSTATILPGSSVQQGFTNGSTVVTLTNTDWTLVPVAALSLPSVRTKAGLVQVNIQTSSTHAEVRLDEAWLFRADDDCALTIVNTESPHLWLDSADASSSVPTVWTGEDASARFHPGDGLLAMGHHVLSPEGTAVFTAAYIDNPATDATFYRRWHSNAAE